MTDRTQFEAMLEALINEDQETAKEIFHNIVVAKSREIYEELLSEDFDMEENLTVEPTGTPEEDMEEAFPHEDDADDSDDSEDDGEVGGDEGDDFVSDVDGEEEGEDMDDEEQSDRILDLEDALEELKAEFEQLMAGEEHEEEENPGVHGGELDGMLGGDEFGGDMGGADIETDERMFEYVNKVSLPKHGDNGVNTKSIVASKNDMGGTTANIAKNFSTTTGGTKGGLLKPTTSIQDAGNVNKPGANVGKTAFKKKEPGHGAEKKGAGEVGGVAKQSLIGKKVR